MSGKYSDYNRLPLLFKRISFENKMDVLFRHSESINRIWMKGSTKEMSEYPVPAVLEQICMMFVDGAEYGAASLKETEFAAIYSTVYDQTSDYLHSCFDKGSSALILQELGLTQFVYQQKHEILRFRYSWFFSYCSDKLDMQKHYSEKFGIPYERFEMLSYAIDLFSLASDSPVKPLVYAHFLSNVFSDCVNYLRISRKEYQDLNSKYSMSNIQNYAYCIRPSYTYAIIEWQGKLFIPLPHLLARNITSSFMYRLTEGNNSLREKIGRHLFEAYLYFLINESGAYTAVRKECEYRKGTNKLSSPDVLAHIEDDVVLFDSKSTVPKAAIRLLLSDEINGQIDILAGHIVQLYNRMQEFNLYNPFELSQISKENLWGIVVIQEDPYTERKRMYQKAAEKLGISQQSEDYKWLVTHIMMFDIYEIEKVHLYGGNIMSTLRARLSQQRWYDFDNTIMTNTKPIEAFRVYDERQTKWDEMISQEIYQLSLTNESVTAKSISELFRG